MMFPSFSATPPTKFAPRSKAAVIAVMALVALSGCSGEQEAASIDNAAANGALLTSTTQQRTATSNPQAPVSRCPKEALSFTSGDRTEVNPGQFEVPLVFTNTSATTCTMSGHPGLAIRGEVNGNPRVYLEQHYAGQGETVELRPGGTAISRFTYLSTTSPEETACTEGVPFVPESMVVAAPENIAQFTVPWVGGTFNSCQAGATRPGDYLSPLE